MLRVICSGLLVCLLVTPLAATSKNILGIVVEVVDGAAVVRVLWDSEGKDQDGDMRITLSKTWDGCVTTLDGEESTIAEAVKPGRAFFTYFNRGRMRMIACTSLPEGRLEQLRPAGQGYLVARTGAKAVAVTDSAGKEQTDGLVLHLRPDGVGKVAPLVIAPRLSPFACTVTAHELRVAGGKVTGTLDLVVPGMQGKRGSREPKTFSCTVDLPVAGGEGTIVFGERAVAAKVAASAIPPLPPQAVVWLTVSDQHRQALVLRVVDGKPVVEGSCLVMSKGHTVGTVTEASGSIDGESFSFDVKAGDQAWAISGTVCGDRLFATSTIGETEQTIWGSILPADCVWRGRLGLDKAEIPAR